MITQDIRNDLAAAYAACDAVDAAYAVANAGGAGLPPRAPADCLGGPVPGAISMIAAEQDMGYYNARCSYFDRMQTNIPDGSVVFVGDSLTDAWCASGIHPYGVNHGIGGDTARGVHNRLARHTALRRAGAGVLLIGINDLCYERNIWGTSTAVGDLKILFSHFAQWMTGRWVIIKLLPVAAGFPACTNADIDATNSAIVDVFGSKPGCVVLDLKPTLAPNGALRDDYHIGDKMHLNGAGYIAATPVVRQALSSLGV